MRIRRGPATVTGEAAPHERALEPLEGHRRPGRRGSGRPGSQETCLRPKRHTPSWKGVAPDENSTFPRPGRRVVLLARAGRVAGARGARDRDRARRRRRGHARCRSDRGDRRRPRRIRTAPAHAARHERRRRARAATAGELGGAAITDGLGVRRRRRSSARRTRSTPTSTYLGRRGLNDAPAAAESAPAELQARRRASLIVGACDATPIADAATTLVVGYGAGARRSRASRSRSRSRGPHGRRRRRCDVTDASRRRDGAPAAASAADRRRRHATRRPTAQPARDAEGDQGRRDPLRRRASASPTAPTAPAARVDRERRRLGLRHHRRRRRLRHHGPARSARQDRLDPRRASASRRGKGPRTLSGIVRSGSVGHRRRCACA